MAKGNCASNGLARASARSTSRCRRGLTRVPTSGTDQRRCAVRWHPVTAPMLAHANDVSRAMRSLGTNSCGPTAPSRRLRGGHGAFRRGGP